MQFQQGIFPIRKYNHHLSLIMSLIPPIMTVFFTTYISYYLQRRYSTHNLVLFCISAFLFIVSDVCKIVMYSTTITISKLGKHVPILGKITTLRVTTMLESMFGFLDLTAFNLGLSVTTQGPISYYISCAAGVGVVGCAVVLLCSLIPSINRSIACTLSVLVCSCEMLAYYEWNSAVNTTMTIISLAFLCVGNLFCVIHVWN